MRGKRGFKRKSMGRGKSKRVFRKTAGSHKKNFRGSPMRGGIRL